MTPDAFPAPQIRFAVRETEREGREGIKKENRKRKGGT